MPPSEQSRVFISYAHKDGAKLAQRLQSDLSNQGFDAWIDKQRLKGGASWTNAIETALDEADYVLALLTNGSYVSEICRAEQLRALRKNKCVIPLLAERGTEIPLHLETKEYRDFGTNDYGDVFAELLNDIHGRRGIRFEDTRIAVMDHGVTRRATDIEIRAGDKTFQEDFRQKFRETNYVTVPPLPANFVDRPEAITALRDALITDGGGRHMRLIALEGMGGIGKTVLAAALCNDEVVQQAFPDGIIWITIGKESMFDVVTRMREVGKALGDDLSRYDNELGAMNQYRSTIRNRAALIVVDDVWEAKDVDPLRAESSRSRLLFTARDKSIAAALGAHQHTANLPTEEQSRSVLALWSGTEIAKLPSPAGELILECRGLPLALSMVGAMLRGKPLASWEHVRDLLRNADLAKISADFPNYPYPNLLAALQVSVDALDATTCERYLALAVLLEDMSIAPAIQQWLWRVGESEAVETAENLLDLSLAQRDGANGSIRLHDLQLDYARGQHPDKKALTLIHEAARLSLQVIGKDPSQFASQMVGRLLSFEAQPTVNRFLKGLHESAPCPWLRPLRPTLKGPAASEFVRSLTGHSGNVNGVALSAEGQRAVSASDDKTLKVWEVESGRELGTLKGHTGPVLGVALTGDGRLAVSASSDKTLKVWEVESGRELRTLEGHTNAVSSVALSADGRLAVSASKDKTLKVWEVESGTELRSLPGPIKIEDGKVWDLESGRELRVLPGPIRIEGARVWDLESRRELRALPGPVRIEDGKVWEESGRELRPFPSPIRIEGTRVSDVESRRELRILPGPVKVEDGKVWDLESGRELPLRPGHTNFVLGVALSGDGRLAVSASSDKTLKVWEVESGRELRTLKGHTSNVIGVALSGDARLAVSASSDKTLKVWEVESGRELHTLRGHSDSVRGVAMSGDGRLAVSASADKTLKVWGVESGRELRTLRGHTWPVTGLAMSEDGWLAVSASYDWTLKVWEVGGGEQYTQQGQADRVNCVAMSRDGRLAISASYDKTLKVWEAESGRELRTLKGHTNRAYGVALSGDGRLAVSASSDKTLKVWEVESGRELCTLKGHTSLVTGVAMSGDGQLAVSGSWDYRVKVWKLGSRREPRYLKGLFAGMLGMIGIDARIDHELRTLTGHSNYVTGVAMSGDGRLAVSASRDRTLKVWDVESGRELHTLRGHLDWVSGVAMSGDGRLAISASYDMTLKVWEVESGRELHTLRGHSGSVTGVALSQDERLAVSASDDDTVKVWDVESGASLATFTCEAKAYSCASSDVHKLIFAGDDRGRIHFLRLEEPKAKD